MIFRTRIQPRSISTRMLPTQVMNFPQTLTYTSLHSSKLHAVWTVRERGNISKKVKTIKSPRHDPSSDPIHGSASVFQHTWRHQSFRMCSARGALRVKKRQKPRYWTKRCKVNRPTDRREKKLIIHNIDPGGINRPCWCYGWKWSFWWCLRCQQKRIGSRADARSCWRGDELLSSISTEYY